MLFATALIWKIRQHHLWYRICDVAVHTSIPFAHSGGPVLFRRTKGLWRNWRAKVHSRLWWWLDITLCCEGGLNKGGRKCRKVEWERGGHDLVLLEGIRFGQSSADRHYVGASFVGMLWLLFLPNVTYWARFWTDTVCEFQRAGLNVWLTTCMQSVHNFRPSREIVKHLLIRIESRISYCTLNEYLL